MFGSSKKTLTFALAIGNDTRSSDSEEKTKKIAMTKRCGSSAG
jgi:hypothetical protein